MIGIAKKEINYSKKNFKRENEKHSRLRIITSL